MALLTRQLQRWGWHTAKGHKPGLELRATAVRTWDPRSTNWANGCPKSHLVLLWHAQIGSENNLWQSSHISPQSSCLCLWNQYTKQGKGRMLPVPSLLLPLFLSFLPSLPPQCLCAPSMGSEENNTIVFLLMIIRTTQAGCAFCRLEATNQAWDTAPPAGRQQGCSNTCK